MNFFSVSYVYSAMPKKQNLQNNQQFMPLAPTEEESDDGLEYVPPTRKPKTMPMPSPGGAFEPSPQPKPKQKRNISEEQKAVLRERLKIAHQRKQELAEERRRVKELEAQNHNEKKQLTILQEAEKLKKRREKELQQIQVPVQKPAKKR